MSILDYFPGSPRWVQRSILEQVEALWEDHDVFVLQCPTASGKTMLAITIAAWANNTSIIVPNNVLLDQYTNEFPSLNTLRKRSSYRCKTFDRSCEETHRKLKRCCAGGDCAYTSSVKATKNATCGVYNYYTYLVHKLYRSTLIIDEAHLIIPMLQDLAAKKIWRYQYGWPTSIQSIGDVLAWIEACANPDKKLKKLHAELLTLNLAAHIQRCSEMWRGKEERELLKLTPLDVRDEPPILWPPHKVRKIVLMSATIGRPDLECMGLSKKRVAYIECPSPIPTENRPIIYHPIGNMSYKHQDNSIPVMAKYIKYLLEEYPDKGLIHCPYSVANKLHPYLVDEERLIWHGREDKQAALGEFLDSEDSVLIASGLYEGIDLSYEEGRWQLITKIPYPSLADPAIRAKMNIDHSWYAWQAIRTILQASGRICRTESDYGRTIIADSMFEQLYKRNSDLFPDWWLDALLI